MRWCKVIESSDLSTSYIPRRSPVPKHQQTWRSNSIPQTPNCREERFVSSVENAVGKTRFPWPDWPPIWCKHAKCLARALRRWRADLKKHPRPLFTRVLAVSFSAFDKFTLPEKEGSSYVYCGIRTEGGKLSRKDLVQRYRYNLGRIRDGNRQNEWQRSMMRILGTVDEELSRKARSRGGRPKRTHRHAIAVELWVNRSWLTL